MTFRPSHPPNLLSTPDFVLLAEGDDTAITVVDAELRYLYLNPAAERLANRDREQLIGRRMLEEFPDAETRSPFYEPMLRALRQQAPITVEGKLFTADRWYEVRFHPFNTSVDSSGSMAPPKNAAGMIIYSRDITGRKQVEEEARQDELFWRNMTDALPQLVWAEGPQGDIRFLNHAFREYACISEGQESRLDWYTLIHLDDLAATQESMTRSRLSGTPCQHECRMLRVGDGQYRWHLTRSTPGHDTKGNITGWFSIATDIHDRREAEAVLREAEERLRLALDAAQMGTWDFDFATGQGWLSEQSLRLFGLPTEYPLISFLDWKNAIHVDDRDPVMAVFDAAVRERGSYLVEYRTTFPAEDGGERWVLSKGAITVDEQGKPVRGLGTNRDITNAKRDQERVEAAERDLATARAAIQAKASILDALMRFVPEGITVAEAPDVAIRMISHYGQLLVGREEQYLLDGTVEEHPRQWGIFHTDGITLATPEELPLTRATVAGEVVENEEWMMAQPGGTPIVVSCNAGPIRDENGAITGGLIAWRDITEQHRLRRHQSRIAETLVRSLLIEPDLMQFDRLELCPLYFAASEDRIGGDIYDAFAIDGGRVALVVGDVMGKGLSASVNAADIKFSLRAYLRLYPEADPAVAMALMNHHFHASNRLDERKKPVILCLTLAVLDPTTGTLRVGVAGMESPLVFRAAMGLAEAIVQASGAMLGIEREWQGNTAQIHIEDGDLLLLYTDGLTEARKSGSANFFGLEGVASALEAQMRRMPDNVSLSSVTEGVMAAARAFAGGRLDDDCCLLLARYVNKSDP